MIERAPPAARHSQVIKQEHEWMRYRALLLLSPFLLTSCANIVPSFDIPTSPITKGPTVQSIVDRVTCELAELVSPESLSNPEKNVGYFLLTAQYEVAVQLDLSVNDTGGLAPSLTYTAGIFEFGASAKVEQSREQTFHETLFYNMLNLQEQMITRDREIAAGAQLPRIGACPITDTNLAGKLGIRQAVEMAADSDYLQVAKQGDQGAFGGQINFTVTKNLNGVGPTWTLTHFKGPGGLGSVSEVNTDKLTFAFAEATHPLTPEQLTERAIRLGLMKGIAPKRKPSIVGPTAVSSRIRNPVAESLLGRLTLTDIATQLHNIRVNTR
ncbi:hypothetical protein BSR47_00335 [Bradyrhizobium canariense]|nr:hypothetical protein BSR47_00335 [Bradyrhizobium canariense]